MYRPLPMNDPSSRTTAQSTPNRAAVLSPLKYRRLTRSSLPSPPSVTDGPCMDKRLTRPGRSRTLSALRPPSSYNRSPEASMRIVGGITLVALAALALAACAPADDGAAATADPGTLQTVTDGVLTIGT